jgi:hypothetical protein
MTEATLFAWLAGSQTPQEFVRRLSRAAERSGVAARAAFEDADAGLALAAEVEAATLRLVRDALGAALNQATPTLLPFKRVMGQRSR